VTTLCGFPIFIVLLMPSLSLSQSAHDECPEGLRYAGTLKGNGSFAEPLNTRVEIKLPDNAMLDISYQQANVVADNGQSNRSKLRPEDIPRGIHIVPDVQSDLGKSWAVSDPLLKEHETLMGKTRYVLRNETFLHDERICRTIWWLRCECRCLLAARLKNRCRFRH
jgi:hypothetical protein